MLKIRECKKLMKKCKVCGELKFISDFYKGNKTKDGYRCQCKVCMSNKANSRHLLVCLECGKEFTSRNKKQKFCSQECMGKWNSKQNRQEVLCDYCKEPIKLPKWRIEINNHHFCNCECYNKWQSKKMKGENNPNYNSEEALCDYCKKTIKVKKNEIERNNHHFCNKECYDKWQSSKEEVSCDYCKEPIKLRKSEIERSNHHFCSQECYSKWSSENKKGENNPNWNPNLTDKERQECRGIEGYSAFVKQVLKRDNYTCQITGKRDAKLEVHHLNCYSKFKEERTDINNGITLSKEIHRLFHKIYGNKHNTKEQFEEFKHRYHNGEFKEVV